LWPAAAIAVTTVAFTLVGESFSAGGGLETAESTHLERVT
jgi:hypothetical protein